MFSKDHKGHVHHLLCVDIGTHSIKACIFEENEDCLSLKGLQSIPQQFGNIQGGTIVDISQTSDNIKAAVKEVETKAKVSPRQMVIGVSGKMIKGMSVTLDYLRSHPEKEIAAQELKTIIYELQWKAFELIRSELAEEMGMPALELKLINASIISVRVDDVQVKNPKGLRGEKVSIDIFNCFSPLQHFGQIQSLAVELSYHELKGVFNQSFAVCHSLLLKNALESAIVIDIGAGTTDICVISNGKLIGNRSFSMAGNSLSKRISYELSTSFEDAEAVKLSYSANSLEKQSQNAIREALQSDIDIWISSLEFSLKELPMQKLPSKLLLCGKSHLLPEFQRALKAYDWGQHFPVEDEEIAIRPLDYSDILEGDFDAEHFDPQYLPLLAVANTAFDLLYHNPELDTILNTIIADKGL
ncbi:MAG: cell division FtsA domain-containing protein [bacterium]|nr:cell division FtsA domain-containing protein [bacterium]